VASRNELKDKISTILKSRWEASVSQKFSSNIRR